MRFVDIRKAAARQTKKEDSQMDRSLPIDDYGQKVQSIKPNYMGDKGTASDVTRTLRGPIIGPNYTMNSSERASSKRQEKN